MDQDTAVICAVVIACAAAVIVSASDKRGLRAERTRTSKFRTTTFEQAMQAKHTDWFKKKLRCTKSSFVFIYKSVYRATARHPGLNAKHKLIKRVALTMLYLVQGGTMDEAATVLGIYRARAVNYINETLQVLSTLSRKLVVMPSDEELADIEAGFGSVAGFPDVVGAIDGTLIKIPRPHDFEGWYCRKNVPAVNVQAIVDHRGWFRSLSIRAGSNNDQSLWNGSGVKKTLSKYIPPGKHLIGDAGYKIWRHLLTPFPEQEAAVDTRMRTYNKAHSRTRIAVKCAFGWLKNRFRILLGKLEQKTSGSICNVILGCVVLYNLLVLANDTYDVDGLDPMIREEPPAVPEDCSDQERNISNLQGIAKHDDIADILAGIDLSKNELRTAMFKAPINAYACV